eukprot:scaffold187200_cov33-Tisochrysis_lutea.AAC.1
MERPPCVPPARVPIRRLHTSQRRNAHANPGFFQRANFGMCDPQHMQCRSYFIFFNFANPFRHPSPRHEYTGSLLRSAVLFRVHPHANSTVTPD